MKYQVEILSFSELPQEKQKELYLETIQDSDCPISFACFSEARIKMCVLPCLWYADFTPVDDMFVFSLVKKLIEEKRNINE